MIWLFAGRASGRAAERTARSNRAGLQCSRSLVVERLESRTLLASLPYGALPGDTAEYMLGDVAVTVVLMESDPTLAPFDNLPPPRRNAPAENWTPAAKADVKAKIETALQWWEDTLDLLPNVRDGLLNFTVDWTYLNNPVLTGYEPINRISEDYVLWSGDFLKQVGFEPPSTQVDHVLTSFKAYNDFRRQQAGADWAFTILVVNNANDADLMFQEGGSFRQAFSFAGGYMSVIPASRPASIIAHEIGHQFWALDEYAGASSYNDRRGYYNTQNLNAVDNHPQPFTQADSLMAADNLTANPPKLLLSNAYAAHTSSPSSLQMIGWKDSDNDGIFDVLDVPFALSGVGKYNAGVGKYEFQGSTSVATLINKNSAGLVNDITINQIRRIEAQIDNGPWIDLQVNLPARTYQTALNLSIPVPAGQHTIKIRSVDTRTGAMSPEFVGTTGEPAAAVQSGIDGFVFLDSDNDGIWDAGEPPFGGYGVKVLDQSGAPVDLRGQIEPNEWAQGAILNNVQPAATLTAIGDGVNDITVLASQSTLVPAAGKVFANTNIVNGATTNTWTSGASLLPAGERRLKVTFASPVSTVSIKAYRGSNSGSSYGRIEAYNASNQLIDRFTSGPITSSNSAVLSVNRAANDIAYVIVGGHITTEVMLDSLEWGAASTTTTDDQGHYSLPDLPPGNYQVRLESRTGHTVTLPLSGAAAALVTAEQPATGVNFGVFVAGNIWHNAAFPTNVNGDPNNFVSPIDALLVITWLNANSGGQELPQTGNPAQFGYIDVNGDRFCTPIDAVLVINALNGGGGGEGEALAALAAGPSTNTSNGADPSLENTSGGGEGEQLARPPQTPAEYLEQAEFHLLHVPGSARPCLCGECTAIRVESLLAAADTAAAASTDMPLGWLAEDLASVGGKRKSRL